MDDDRTMADEADPDQGEPVAVLSGPPAPAWTADRTRKRDYPRWLAWILGFLASLLLAGAADSGAVEFGIVVALIWCLVAGLLSSVDHSGRDGAIQVLLFPSVVAVLIVMAGVGALADGDLSPIALAEILAFAGGSALFIGAFTDSGCGIVARLFSRARDDPGPPRGDRISSVVRYQ
jgi:hypothetical protein